jgi:hypothetical protein
MWFSVGWLILALPCTASTVCTALHLLSLLHVLYCTALRCRYFDVEERIELWGLQIPHNSVRPPLVEEGAAQEASTTVRDPLAVDSWCPSACVCPLVALHI